jgi:hypothetical protein
MADWSSGAPLRSEVRARKMAAQVAGQATECSEFHESRI